MVCIGFLSLQVSQTTEFTNLETCLLGYPHKDALPAQLGHYISVCKAYKHQPEVSLSFPICRMGRRMKIRPNITKPRPIVITKNITLRSGTVRETHSSITRDGQSVGNKFMASYSLVFTHANPHVY